MMFSRGSTRMPPVGKSGPGMKSTSFSTVAFGCLIRWSSAVHSSSALCGGILVAMPTAMPDEPFARRFGKLAGRTTGSWLVPS